MQPLEHFPSSTISVPCFDKSDTRNLSMLFDFYEATMSNGYILKQKENTIAVFDLFFRKIPDKGGYVIMAGLSQVITYLQNLHFTSDDINYLRSKKVFSEEFLTYLKNFKFTCDVFAVREGTVVFPNEPILTIVGPLLQSQFIETMLLLCINHQSLIATKSSRIKRSAGNKTVMEFGSRRAQGFDGAVYGARAAFIGGCDYSSCAYSDEVFGVPAIGTMAHSWIQSFDSEYEAFKAWAEIYPDNCVLLIDTYHVIESGVANAIKVFNEVLKPLNKRPKGVRIDSGDLIQLTKECRAILNANGYDDVKIIVSNSLDEYRIETLLNEGACIDSFGVGERLITARSEPVFGGVYKLVAIKNKNGEYVPKIKLSESIEKVTNPGFKTIVRVYDKHSHKAMCDVICFKNETLNENDELILNDGTVVKDYYLKDLHVQIFKEGELVYKQETLSEIKEFAKSEVMRLSEHLLSLKGVEKGYQVILSKELSKKKNELINSL